MPLSVASSFCGLPDPMLSRPGPRPSGSGWSFELKWDGVRAIVSTEGGFAVRSRRGVEHDRSPPGATSAPDRARPRR